MYEEAIFSIDSLLKDYPRDPYFLELKGQIYAENGKINEAINAYEKALKYIDNPATLIMLSLSNMLLEKKMIQGRMQRQKSYLIQLLHWNL